MDLLLAVAWTALNIYAGALGAQLYRRYFKIRKELCSRCEGLGWVIEWETHRDYVVTETSRQAICCKCNGAGVIRTSPFKERIDKMENGQIGQIVKKVSKTLIQST